MLGARAYTCCLFYLAVVVGAARGWADDGAEGDGKDARRPTEFAIIFNMGYAGDVLPQDAADFEKLVQQLKQAHYNVALCKYTEQRAKICAKHDVKILVDLLVPEHHVYKNVEGAKALCEKLRGNKSVWGYHLWSDRFSSVVAGRNRDIKKVQQWDPTHATYVGGYHGRGNNALVNPDVHGYYDFHWVRGGHWRHLFRMHAASRATDSYFLRYCQSDPGKIGKGNYNRALYTVSTSLAFGMKGYLFHYRNGTVDQKGWKWGPLGEDLVRVNAEIAPLGAELMKIGNPTAVYSTPTTKTAKDRAKDAGAPDVPAEFKAVPRDAWFEVASGEAVIGVFRDSDKRDVLLFANHNAYQPQPMVVRFRKGPKQVAIFDRGNAKWKTLDVQDNSVRFELPPAAAEMIRVEGR